MDPAELRKLVSVESMKYTLHLLAIVAVQDAWWLAADEDHPVSCPRENLACQCIDPMSLSGFKHRWGGAMGLLVTTYSSWLVG
jgi:hypothetical protein